MGRTGTLATPGELIHFDDAEVQIFCRAPASSYGWLGNLAVVLVRREPGLSEVESFRACVVELHRQHPTGIGLLTLVKGTYLPDRSTRQATARMLKEIWPLLKGALFCVDGIGFKASVTRGVIGCYISVTGQTERAHIVEAVPGGIDWLAGLLRGSVPSPRFSEMLAREVGAFSERECRKFLPLVPRPRSSLPEAPGSAASAHPSSGRFWTQTDPPPNEPPRSGHFWLETHSPEGRRSETAPSKKR